MTDEILDIRYYDTATWNDYLNNEVVKLYSSVVKFIKIYDQVRNLVGKNVMDLIKDEKYEVILLGGVKEDGSFTEFSVSKFYKEIFGLTFDTNAVVSLLRASSTGIVPIQFKDIKLYNKLQTIYSNLDFVLRAKNITKPNVSFPTLTDYKSVLESLREFAEVSLNFLSVYNPRTFFITSLRGSTLKAFKIAYPRLDKEIFNLFGVSPVWSFSYLNNRDYEIWGYNDIVSGNYETFTGNSIGSALTIVNYNIFSLFKCTYSSPSLCYTENPHLYYINLDRSICSDYDNLISKVKSSPFSVVFSCDIENYSVWCRHRSKDPPFYTGNIVDFLEKVGLPLIYVLKLSSIRDEHTLNRLEIYIYEYLLGCHW
ncbi:hypothetical protein EWF20_10575 [Sulfolobus sp. S-194]|uniref:hypothetical protein n=1 Tax=Sulfolobus sp. S-194 TaxID=2512240 RepID=UPI001436FC41|nr:hypothetical protein [Sulfolobus sp. S-194]QIW24536.1 hypothetical protein EWF20_10575 [Sulfolobus sp. S-194]